MTSDKSESKYLCILLSLTTLIVTFETILLIVQLSNISQRSIYLFDRTDVNVDAAHLVEFSDDSSLVWTSKRTEKFDDVLTTMIRRRYTLLPLREVPAWRTGWIAEPILNSTWTIWAARGTKVLYGYGGNLAYIFSP